MTMAPMKKEDFQNAEVQAAQERLQAAQGRLTKLTAKLQQAASTAQAAQVVGPEGLPRVGIY